ncbi:MAG: HAD family phosphatase [Bacteroides sp.]|nr:HAD family phosphatase [Roseburia sp.]MCM1345588.1 HAD family phosphatase [Bacteroides sp.]MCM1421928.1 HAD family phosphatase [Bacteroides sp.]
MIKNLIFDLGGVVITLNPDEAMRRFEELGIKDAREQMGVYGQTGIFLQVENGTISVDEFCRQLAAQAGTSHCSYEQARWAWLGFVKDVPRQRLDNLLALKEKYNVFLLSNTNPFVMDWARSEAFSGDGHSIEHYFHHTFCSYELNDYKPSASIFHKVLDTMSLKADECVFVDDGQKNVEASESVGMHGLLVEKDADWMSRLQTMLEELG